MVYTSTRKCIHTVHFFFRQWERCQIIYSTCLVCRFCWSSSIEQNWLTTKRKKCSMWNSSYWQGTTSFLLCHCDVFCISVGDVRMQWWIYFFFSKSMPACTRRYQSHFTKIHVHAIHTFLNIHFLFHQWKRCHNYTRFTTIEWCVYLNELISQL